MLKLYLDEKPRGINCIEDVEKGFAALRLECTELEKEIVSVIEKGKLIDDTSFVDRFGYKLYLSELSTGCKAALCVLNYEDSVVDLVECGLNARDVIISLCDRGAAFMYTNSATVASKYSRGKKILVNIDNYIFTEVDRLNSYIFNEYPYNPDLTLKGIERIEG